MIWTRPPRFLLSSYREGFAPSGCREDESPSRGGICLRGEFGKRLLEANGRRLRRGEPLTLIRDSFVCSETFRGKVAKLHAYLSLPPVYLRIRLLIKHRRRGAAPFRRKLKYEHTLFEPRQSNLVRLQSCTAPSDNMGFAMSSKLSILASCPGGARP